MEKIIDWKIPLKICNEANSSEHWTKKSKRHKDQKKQISIIWMIKKPPEIPLPCHVILTRIAPRKLDVNDNLPISFKWVYDSICEHIIPGLAIGRADGDDRITVGYKQEKGKVREYAIIIEIYGM